MVSSIEDKKSKVLIVEQSAAIRQSMVEIMRSTFGYTNVEGIASLADTLGFLEVEDAHWVITSLFADQEVNALHLLKLTSVEPILRNIRVTLYLEESEIEILASAFSCGALSWLKKPFTTDNFTQNIKSFMDILQGNSFQEPLTAASYIRDILKSQSRHRELIELERNLISLYPGNTQLMMFLAEPYSQLGKVELTKSLIYQSVLIDERLEGEANETSMRLLGTPLPKKRDQIDGLDSVENILGISSCIIIDPDESVRRDLCDLLKSLGLQNISLYSDGQECWEALRTQAQPDLVIMEWRIPKISGPILIQKIRHHGFVTCSIIVLSSLIKSDDYQLLKEMSVASIIPKPLTRREFIPLLIGTISQERIPTETQAMERKIFQFLHAYNLPEAIPLIEKFMNDPKVPEGKKRLIDSEVALLKGDYMKSKISAFMSLRLGGDNLLGLNLLGKIFMYLNKPYDALKCFEKAQSLSPKNIERLCQMAENQADLGLHDASMQSINDAKILDPTSEKIESTEAKIAIIDGKISSSRILLSNIENHTSLISYMNNKAVAYAKCGYLNEASELYGNILLSLDENDKEIRSIISYNHALCLVRMNELEKSYGLLSHIVDQDSRVNKKASSLAHRIKRSLENGVELKLSVSTVSLSESAINQSHQNHGKKFEETQSQPSEHEVIEVQHEETLYSYIDVRKGDLCCFLIFIPLVELDQKSSLLIKKMPRFKKRETLEKSNKKSGDDSNHINEKAIA